MPSCQISMKETLKQMHIRKIKDTQSPSNEPPASIPGHCYLMLIRHKQQSFSHFYDAFRHADLLKKTKIFFNIKPLISSLIYAKFFCAQRSACWRSHPPVSL
jgi:hypothetical protein